MATPKPSVHARDHAPGAADTIPWLERVHMIGLLAARPAPGVGNKGAYYFASDDPSGGGGGGGPVGLAQRLVLDTPDAGGFTFPSLSTTNGFTNVRRILSGFAHGGLGGWSGTTRVPPNYLSGPQIVVTAVTAATSGVVRWIVGTAVVAAGASEDTAYTLEAAQNLTVPATARARFDATFNLSTTVLAGADLNFTIRRDGGNAADTCTQQAFIWAATFLYTGTG